MGGLAALGAATALPFELSATDTPLANLPPGLIDLHHHILPPAYMAEARDRVVAQYQGTLPAAVASWTPQEALAEMDRSGVATAIVSISTPGVWFGDKVAARRLARTCNEYAARLVRDHPGRFGFFAAVPLPDQEGALSEIDYALAALKADGIGLMTSYGDRWPGDPAFSEVFEEINRRKAVVYFHPTGPDCCRDLMSYVPYVVTELPHDTTRAITSLLFSGSLSRLRETRFIFSHAGGTMPMLAGRIARAARGREEIGRKLPNGVEWELRRLHYEIAGSANRPAMAALTNLVPMSQILFGTDYPYAPVRTTAEGMRDLGMTDDDLKRIGRENALALFPRLNTA